MTSWTKLEARWRDALLSAMIPPCPEAGLPGLGELDLAPFWRSLRPVAPPLLRLGLRASVWFLTFAPLLFFFSPRLFHRLPPEDRDRFLMAVQQSRFYLVRQMVNVIKVIACFAYFRDPGARAAVQRRAEA